MGLLGGSFNPAHAGHRHIAEQALRRLRLDQVWLLVSPGNPLKSATGMGAFAARLASAQGIGRPRRIVATAIEAALGSRYTLDTLRRLRRRFPNVRFVWLMGADNLAQLPAWNDWCAIVRETSFAVLPRPTYSAAALAGRAAVRWRRARIAARAAHIQAGLAAPAWVYLSAPQHGASATAIRAAHREHNGHRPHADEASPAA